MRSAFLGLTLLVSVAAPLAAEPPSPVLVELFTSEGCSSCPPADALLAELAAGRVAVGAEVVPLSLHVDYWNRLGWRDPFSSAAFSERQQLYASRRGLYTPQMVVDGGADLVGSDRAGASRAISAAARTSKTPLELRVAASPAGLQVRVAAPPLPRGSREADLLLAVTEDGLVSDVARGENAGRKLPHAAVVRLLTRADRARSDAPLAAEKTLKLDPSWRREALHVVAFLQEPDGRVVGVARTSIAR